MRFDRDGFLVVPGALDADTVERVRQGSDRLADPFLRKPEVLNRPEYNHLVCARACCEKKALFDLVTHATTGPAGRAIARPQHPPPFDDAALQAAREP